MIAEIGQTIWGLVGGVPRLPTDPSRKTVILVVVVLAIAGSLTSLWLTQRTSEAGMNPTPFAAQGEVVAEEVAKLLNHRGRIIVITADTATLSQPILTTQWKSFQRALKRSPAITLLATEPVPPRDPTGPSQYSLPTGWFTQIIERYADVDAIVSLVGVPVLSEAEFQRLPQRRPQIVAAAVFGMNLQQPLKQGLVQLAIVPRYEAAPASTTKPKTPREWFDRYYQIVTPANAPADGEVAP